MKEGLSDSLWITVWAFMPSVFIFMVLPGESTQAMSMKLLGTILWLMFFATVLVKRRLVKISK